VGKHSQHFLRSLVYFLAYVSTYALIAYAAAAQERALICPLHVLWGARNERFSCPRDRDTYLVCSVWVHQELITLVIGGPR
jgi:hypothetical protein